MPLVNFRRLRPIPLPERYRARADLGKNGDGAGPSSVRA
jgi:hypothetical protein